MEKQAMVVQINGVVEAVFVRESNPLLIDKAAEIMKERQQTPQNVECMRRTMLTDGYWSFMHQGEEVEFTLAPAWEG